MKLIFFYTILLISTGLLYLASCGNDSSSEKDDKTQKANKQKVDKQKTTSNGFINVLQNVGFNSLGILGQTVSWGDFNKDGNVDIVIGNTDLRGPSLFLYKSTDGKFENITDNSGLSDQPIRSLTWADYDNDGYIDLAVGTIMAGAPPIVYRNLTNSKFVDISNEAGISKKGGFVFHTIWSDYNLDGFVDLFQINARDIFLYKNNGDGTFSEVGAESGIIKKNFTSSAVLFDYNNDMFPDLFLSNGDQDNFFVNNGDGTFKDFTAEAGLGEDDITNSRGGCTGDFNNDGFIDLYIGSMGKRGNVLYKNNGDGTFTDISVETDTRDVGDARTCAFVDYDSDGLLDIFTTNHLSPNKLYKNLGNEKFEDTAEKVGIDKPVDVFGAAWGDYNYDGFMDVFLNGHIGIGLFKNSGNKNNSIVIKLIGNGKSTNTSAIGSRVTLTTSKGTQTREVSGGRGCCEQDMLPVHFGLGKDKNADISVKWTDGSVCSIEELDVVNNTVVSINQKDCKLAKIK